MAGLCLGGGGLIYSLGGLEPPPKPMTGYVPVGNNRKRVCDFLLVRHSNLGHILHVSEILQVFVLLAPPLFHPNFWVFPLRQIAPVGVNVSRYLKLFVREISFQDFQPICDHYPPTSSSSSSSYSLILLLSMSSVCPPVRL